MNRDLQAFKAAKYLHKIKPYRYVWEKHQDYSHLVDRCTLKRYHTREETLYTKTLGYYGHVPIYTLQTTKRDL